MKTKQQIIAIDSHTMGEPTRIITGGIPKISGKTMADKKSYLENNLDYIRTLAMHEPRGHADMFGSIIVNPTLDEAYLGIIFMDGGGYLNMCGHGTIGAMTTAVEMGMVEVTEPYTHITLESPAGLIKGKVRVKDGKALDVTFKNVPAFLDKEDVEICIEGLGKVKLDIAFGGSFFSIVEINQFGVEISPENTDIITEMGIKILKAVNEQIEVKHPYLSHIKSVDLVEFYGPAKSEDATLQNVVVFGKGQVDRSPCGTGTCAKMATLFKKGQLIKGEEFIYESIIQTKFKGKIIDTIDKNGQKFIIPEITASAYLTGINHLLVDPTDPLKYGFSL